MTLTLYSAHVLVLETEVFEDAPGARFLLVVCSLAFAVLWRRWQDQGPWSGSWRKPPTGPAGRSSPGPVTRRGQPPDDGGPSITDRVRAGEVPSLTAPHEQQALAPTTTTTKEATRACRVRAPDPRGSTPSSLHH